MLGLEYSAINAKVRYWLSLLMDDDDVDLLVSSSLNEVMDYIRKREVKVDIESYDTGKIEAQIKQAIIGYIGSGKRFLTGNLAYFCREWLRAYEIENLKIIARAIVGEKEIDFLYVPYPNTKFRIDWVRDIHTLDEFTEYMWGTEYHSIAEDVFPRVKEESNTFYWEIALDNFFAIRLTKATEGLDAPARKAVKDVLFFSYEMNRIMWLYRMKFHYKMTREEILAFIPNIYKILPRSRYRTLVDAEIKEEFLELLAKWHIIDKMPEDVTGLERVMNQEIKQRAKKYLHGSPFSLGVLLAFVVMKSMDVKRYILLLEGKKAGLEVDLIKQMVE